MHNEQSGRVKGTSLQIANVHGDVVLHGNSASAEEDTSAEPTPPDDTQKLKAGSVIVGILIIVIIVIANACGGGSEDPAFPATDQGDRPAGVSDEAVAEVVADKLRLCAAAVVFAPANCPQAHNGQSPLNVRWELVGDPRDGMQVSWDNNRFLARGTAVMIVSYGSESQRKLETERFHFLTEVRWRGDDTRIDVIRQPKSVPPVGTIKKDRFTLPDEDLIKAVRDGFTACVSATPSRMPLACPRTASTPSESARSLDGDPVGNWTINDDDAEYGVLRLTASYSLVHRWTSTFIGIEESHMRPQSGTYEATLIRTPDKTPRLLTIKHVP